ncbi:glycosyltransferase family 2 protein [Notoacmeibacter ruber]|nr:glycosyltransferase [Notoacmeibacter ruber]
MTITASRRRLAGDVYLPVSDFGRVTEKIAPVAVPGAASPRATLLLHPAARRPFEKCDHRDKLIIRVLIRMSWEPADLRDVIHLARREHVTLEEAVLSSSGLERQRWSATLAEESGLPLVAGIDPARLVLPSDDINSLLAVSWSEIAVGYRLPDGRYVRLVPDSVACAFRLPGEGEDDVCMVAGPSLRKALIERLAERMDRRARLGLFSRTPEYSARQLTNAWQSFLLGAFAVFAALGLLFWPLLVLMTVHVLSSSFFLSCMVLRIMAIPYAGTREVRVNRMAEGADVPVYTVLVALYREADMIGQLLTALGRLHWPRGRLEIRLVCEADDRETIEAIHALRPPAHVEVIEVPSGFPRTKPRALNFALQTCRGEYVCLYDAEDRPHPDQLIEAWQAFRQSAPDVACLQAPLIVTNGGDHWLARQFAFEYAALFRGVLRFLAATRTVLPLGGTSNHFRRSVLDEVGGWDPHNVTEDADLGMRMARHGYRSGVINAPTLEDAPDRFRDWLPQRTRWIKGWMVCWLVHNRNPLRLWRELGPRSFLVSQIFLSGIPGAALLLPIMLASFFIMSVGMVAGSDWLNSFQIALFGVDFMNFALCMGAFLILGARAASWRERGAVMAVLPSLCVYWLIQSWAAWRGLFQLTGRTPHKWEKTSHKPAVERLKGKVTSVSPPERLPHP